MKPFPGSGRALHLTLEMVHKEFIRWLWDVQTPSLLPQCSKAQADPELAPGVWPLIICASVSSFGTHEKPETNTDFGGRPATLYQFDL